MVTSRKIAAIPYYGGKFRLARHIVPIIESIPHTVYVEPFAGGASVLFALTKPAPTLVINDANSCLVILYKLMQCYPAELLAKLAAIPFSRLVYQQAKFNLATCDIFDDSFDNQLAIAADTYVSLCMSFGNVLGDDGGWRVDKKRGTDPRTWRNRKINLAHAIDQIDSAYLDCADYASCIARWDSAGTLFYIDPPYVDTDLGHYGSTAKTYSVTRFTATDLQALCATLDQLKGRYILSGYDAGIEPQTALRKLAFSAAKKLGTSGNKQAVETIWTNFS